MWLDILFLALALSVDAFVVALSYGLILKYHRFQNGLNIAFATAFGQFIMPVIGFYLTDSIHDYISEWDHWIGAGVFFLLGIKVIKDAFSPPDTSSSSNESSVQYLSLKMLILIGIATSIDALVAGISIYMNHQEHNSGVWLPAGMIGITTFICASLGFYLTNRFKHFNTKYLQIIAGLVLIGLGVKMLSSHLNLF